MGHLRKEAPGKDISTSKAHGVHRTQGEHDLHPLGRHPNPSFPRCTHYQPTLGRLYQRTAARYNRSHHTTARHTADRTHIISASNKPPRSRQMADFNGKGAKCTEKERDLD